MNTTAAEKNKHPNNKQPTRKPSLPSTVSINIGKKMPKTPSIPSIPSKKRGSEEVSEANLSDDIHSLFDGIERLENKPLDPSELEKLRSKRKRMGE